MLSCQLPLLQLRIARQPLGRLRRAFSVTAPSLHQIHNADEPVSPYPSQLITPAHPSEQTFKSHVAKTNDKVVLVDFYEDWCGPCKVLSPLLERIEREPSLIGAQALDLITLKGENVPNLAIEYKIRAVPTVFAFKNGSVIGQFTGALGLPQIKSWFASLEK